MQKDFWLERWEKAETGFHEKEVNPYLTRFWPELYVGKGNTVFVPLCGKSVDMHWLQQQGYPVIGVELSEIAVQAFFRESNNASQQSSVGKFKQYEANGIRILCGDFFDLCRDDLAEVSAVYDRASMVALPPVMREHYVQHLVSILSPGTKILLVTFDYPQDEMSGPPFALAHTEVEALYSKHAEIRLLEKFDVLPQNPRFQKRGLTRLQESIYIVSCK